MSIAFQLPEHVESVLRNELGDLEQLAKEAFAIEAYRSGKLSLGQLAELLGLSQYEADGLLKQRGVLFDVDEEELARQRETLRRLLSK
jgi:predicted HTH domain antitoxin